LSFYLNRCYDGTWDAHGYDAGERGMNAAFLGFWGSGFSDRRSGGVPSISLRGSTGSKAVFILMEE